MSERRVYTSAGRRRLTRLKLAAVAAALLLGLVVAWARVSDVRPAAEAPVVRSRAHSRALHLAWPPEGQAALAIQGSGYVGSTGEEEPVPIASLAKVMTAYLVLRDHPLEPGEEGFTMTIGPADVDDLRRRLELNQSVVAVEVGEQLSERDALEALLLPSANNVATLLAVHDAGSVEAFVAEMNEAAVELEMVHTRYTDPSGFEETTVSTAVDQLKLAKAAMTDPTFSEIVAMTTAWVPVAGEVTNFNALVGHEGFVGIKTGSDQAAGGCLLFAKRIEAGNRTQTLLGAVLGQRDGDFIQAALEGAQVLAASATGRARRF